MSVACWRSSLRRGRAPQYGVGFCPPRGGGVVGVEMTPESAAVSVRRRAKVLIVDDHPVVRYGLLQMLSNEPDFEVCGEAASAQEALALVDQRKPDIAVVDISLKGSNGIELVKQIHAMRPEARILVSSMHDEKLFAERALRAGASGYINKQV